MARRLAHRGPGDLVVLERGGLALAVARLHVVARDAPSGPYVTACGSVAAAVNGEIWNHEELRADLVARGFPVPPGADTAVVAPLYLADGIAGLARLRGMFAAALHDARDGSVVLARDRFGIKPLYYEPGPPLRFASEAGALPGSSSVDRAALADYLALGAIPAPATIDPAVRQVEPGTALRVLGGAFEVHRFASPTRAVPGTSATAAEVRSALERSVARHLTGELPVAVLLSGGIDSAAIAALVARSCRELTGRAVRTVTCAIPGAGRYDEHRAALLTAAHLDANAVVGTLSAEDVPELLDAVLAAHGGPFADASALATHRLCRTAARVAGVVLSGTGADEVFAGYRRYALGRTCVPLTAVAAWAAAVLPTTRTTRLGAFGALVRKASRAGTGGTAERYLEALSVVPSAWRARLLGDQGPPPVLERVRAAFASSPHFADGARAADLSVYLPDDVLAKEDRAASAVSIENRVPFLDDDVADLAGRTPAASLGMGALGGGKALLRAAVADLLPRSVLRRRKRGFGVPVSEWMHGPLRTFVLGHLADPRSLIGDHLDSGAVADLVAQHHAGDDDLGAAVWSLVVLEAALRRRSPT